MCLFTSNGFGGTVQSEVLLFLQAPDNVVAHIVLDFPRALNSNRPVLKAVFGVLAVLLVSRRRPFAVGRGPMETYRDIFELASDAYENLLDAVVPGERRRGRPRRAGTHRGVAVQVL